VGTKLLTLAIIVSFLAPGAIAAPLGSYPKGVKHATSPPARVDEYHHALPSVTPPPRAKLLNPAVSDPDPQVRHNTRINQTNQ
jgi:hypothetical protein